MKVKKAQVGKSLPKKKAVKMVESEMTPGKMIPESDIRRGAYITIDSKKKAAKPVPKKKMKSGGELGMKSVKAGYDNNPGVTRADIISAATGKAKNGAKVASKKVVGKKPIKKAQDGGEAPLVEGMTLPEFTKTASRIVDKPKKAAKPQKNYTREHEYCSWRFIYLLDKRSGDVS